MCSEVINAAPSFLTRLTNLSAEHLLTSAPPAAAQSTPVFWKLHRFADSSTTTSRLTGGLLQTFSWSAITTRKHMLHWHCVGLSAHRSNNSKQFFVPDSPRTSSATYICWMDAPVAPRLSRRPNALIIPPRLQNTPVDCQFCSNRQ